MSDALNRETAEFGELQGEASLLSYLLSQYVDDQNKATERRLIYFVDSHEIKAYIHASQEDLIRGFLLEPENRLLDKPEYEHLATDLRMKSERVLQWLLFETGRPVVLLPSHGDEVNGEIAHLTHRQLHEDQGLIQVAEAQVERIQNRVLSTKLLDALDMVDDSRTRNDLLEFVGQSAPAVAALLRLSPNSTAARIARLVRRSDLVTLENTKWEAYGYSAEVCEKLRNAGHDYEILASWRDRFERSPVRGAHSHRANRADFEAVAYVCRLNQLFADLGLKDRAVLVTRTRTILDVVREHVGKGKDVPVRHVRLLVSRQPDLSEPDAKERSEDVRTTLESLTLALRTYVQQLEAPSWARPTQWLKRDQHSLVTALHEFERARFTIDLARTGEDKEKAFREEQLGRLLHWLRTAEEIETLVVERLKHEVWNFGHEVFSRSEPLRLRTYNSSRSDRALVRPMGTVRLGPIVFSRSFLSCGEANAEDGSRHDVDFRQALKSPSGDAAEAYLALSLLQGCLANWPLAAIYADSAVRSSLILGRSEAFDEAVLLYSQIARLGGMKSRIERASDRLQQVFEDAYDGKDLLRHELERSLLTLEGALHEAKIDEEGCHQISSHLRHLVKLFRTAPDDRMSKAEIAEIGLVFIYALVHRTGASNITVESFGEAAQEFQGALTAWLSEERCVLEDSQHLPGTSRAIEIVGYDLIAPLPAEDSSTRGVPESILFGANELQLQLSAYPDQLSHMLSAALTEIMQMNEKSSPKLINAPVWTRAISDEVFAEITDRELNLAVLRATRAIHEVGDDQNLLEDMPKLKSARLVLRDALTRMEGMPDSVVFHLSMEYCYAGLLVADVAKIGSEERQALYEELDGLYGKLLSLNPRSAVLHYRRSLVFDELKRFDEALSALFDALTCMGADEFTPKGHWVRGTIRRRIGAHYARKADEERRKLYRQPKSPEPRRRCLDLFAKAFGIVYDDFEAQPATHVYRAWVDARRRLNNIVFYAARYVEVGGTLMQLAADLNQERILKYVDQLGGGRIEGVEDWDVLHTIGLAFHVFGRPEQARAVADRLWTWDGDYGEKPDGREEIFREIVSWRLSARASGAVVQT